MRGKQLLGGLLAFFAVTQLSASQMSVPYGWYVEGNGGYSTLTGASYPGKVNSSGFGGNANLGYKFMPYVGVEIGYSLYAGTSMQMPGTGTLAAKAKHYSYDIAARGILPIVDSGFELFAKLGAQHIASSVSIKNQTDAAILGISDGTKGSTGLYLGAGGQYYIYPELAVVAQWQRAKGNSNSGTEDLYSLGLSFILV